MRGMGNFGATTHGTSAEASFSPTSRLKNQSDYPPRPPMSSGMMTHTAGIGSPESATFVESHRNDAGYMTGGFPTSSWDDSALLSDNYLKGFAENQVMYCAVFSPVGCTYCYPISSLVMALLV